MSVPGAAVPSDFTNFTSWCYTGFMKRASVTLPDDLAKAVETYRQAQENPPVLTAVVQAALREYLRERGFLRAYRPLRLTAVGRSGRGDISAEHDAYLAGIKK
jgi:hypothetical protein